MIMQVSKQLLLFLVDLYLFSIVSIQFDIAKPIQDTKSTSGIYYIINE